METIHDGRRLDAMCADVAQQHASLRRALPRIHSSLATVSAATAPPGLDLIRVAFTALADLIETHLSKEEHLLLPALRALCEAEDAGRSRPPLPFATLLHPIRMLETEHLRIENALDQLRDYAADVWREPATSEWRHCLGELSRLDEELRTHDRFENEVLFPAALDLERRLL